MHGDPINERLDFGQTVETLKSVAGQEVRVIAPCGGAPAGDSGSIVSTAVWLGGPLVHRKTKESAAVFECDNGTISVYAEDFVAAYRSAADQGEFFWITIESTTGSIEVRTGY